MLQLEGTRARLELDVEVGHDAGDTRYSPLSQVNEATVGRLRLAWYHDLDTHRGQEATPVVIDGVMYSTSAWSKVQAFDAASGKLLWQFDPKVPGKIAIHVCCDVVNRGVAVSKGRVFVGTLDGRLIALDARSGKPIWTVSTVEGKRPYTVTGAPLIAGNRVIINSGSLNSSSTFISNNVFTIGNGSGTGIFSAVGGTHFFDSGIIIASNSYLAGTGNILAGSPLAITLTNGGLISAGIGRTGIGAECRAYPGRRSRLWRSRLLWRDKGAHAAP